MQKTKFWLEDPKILVSNAKFLPTEDDCINDKLNSVTKIIIIIGVFLIIFRWKYALEFLLIALLIILTIYLINQNQTNNNTNMANREFFHEDINNLKFYKNKEIPNNNITMAQDIENEFRTIFDFFTYIREPIFNPNVQTIVQTTSYDHIEQSLGVTRESVNHSINEPINEPIPQQKAIINNSVKPVVAAPLKRVRKTAYDLQREAYMNDHIEDGIDTIEQQRHNMINGIY